MCRSHQIKVAVVTPEGSVWVKVLRDMAADIKSQTHDEVTMTIYAAGVRGDESNVLY